MLSISKLCVACPALRDFGSLNRPYFFDAKKGTRSEKCGRGGSFAGLRAKPSRPAEIRRQPAAWIKRRAKPVLTHFGHRPHSAVGTGIISSLGFKSQEKRRSCHRILSAYQKSMQKSVEVPCHAACRPHTSDFAALPPISFRLRDEKVSSDMHSQPGTFKLFSC